MRNAKKMPRITLAAITLTCGYGAVVALIMLAGACNRNSDTDAPHAGYTALPDVPAIARDYKNTLHKQIESTRRFLHRVIQGSTIRYRDSSLHVAQALAALRLLDEGTLPERRPPVLLMATANYTMDGEPVLGLDWVNLNRETYRYHIIICGPDAAIVHTLIEDTQQQKDNSILSSRMWRLEPVSWDLYKEHGIADADGLLRVNIGDVSVLPYAIGEQVSAYAAIEDRTGRMSSFLPLGTAFGCRSFAEGSPSEGARNVAGAEGRDRSD